jgi:D-alanyl-D-alanine carboxypeptidase
MMFSWRSQYYEYCVGGKTGYTDKALNTLVTLASKDGMNLVAVVLRTHGMGNTYNDTRTMLDYAFENFSKVAVTEDMVEVSGFKSIDPNAHVTLPSGITFDQLDCAVDNPTALGDKSGKLIYTYEGQPVGEVEFTITDEYYNQIHGIEEVKEKDKSDKKNADKGQAIGIVIRIVFGILGVVLVLFLLLLCYVAYKRHQIRKRRKARRMKRQRELEYQRYLERMQNNDK